MHQDSLKRHITHLEDLHSKLEKDLAELELHHENDTVKAQEIKKKKLHVKDEIEKCKHNLQLGTLWPSY